MTTALIVIAALLLDRLFGEPTRWHPLVGFGRLISAVEGRLRRDDAGANRQLISGAVGWLLLVAPPVILVLILLYLSPDWADCLLSALILYAAIAPRSLAEHARAVAAPLLAGDLAAARERVGYIVSRDTRGLDANGATRAAVESVLENGADAVIAPLFWFLLAGAPGVVLHRLANTLDARWGYRNATYLHFGRIAARADDVLNWLPARLCALLYCLCGHWASGRQCWRAQGHLTASPNAGVVMAAGAGALHIELGGPAVYHGAVEWRPTLGCGDVARVDGQHNDIERALTLLNSATWLLAAAVMVFAMGAMA